MSLKPKSAWPLILTAAALLIPVVQLIAGVPMVGVNRAHDGAFAVSTLVQYTAELRAGYLFPGWAAAGFDGLGSPIFFFYPPGAYLFASLIAVAMPALPAASVVGIAQILFRIGAIASCFFWLRRRISTRPAIIGGALFALMPWVCTFNPQIRMDFAECAAASLVTLVFWAIDSFRQRSGPMILAVAASMFLLSLVHLPTLVATAGLALVYAAAGSRAWWDALRQASSVAAGTLLGMALAGWYLLPALGLLHEISPSALWDPLHRPEGHFILGLASFHRSFLLLDLGLLVPGVLVVLSFGLSALDQKDLRQGARQQAGGLWFGATALPIRALTATFAISAFMAMPLSAPLWAHLTPLRMIQFPGRFLMPASLMAAALIASLLPLSRPRLHRLITAIGLMLAGAGIVLAVTLGDKGSSGRLRTEQALMQKQSNAPEYVPAAAAAHGWLQRAQSVGISHDRAAGLVSACVQSRALRVRQQRAQLAFHLSGCQGPTILPQFFFRGWAGRADGRKLTVRPNIRSGLVEADVPLGTQWVTLNHRQLPIERRGLLCSLIALLVFSILGLRAGIDAGFLRRLRADRRQASIQRSFTR